MLINVKIMSQDNQTVTTMRFYLIKFKNLFLHFAAKELNIKIY